MAGGVSLCGEARLHRGDGGIVGREFRRLGQVVIKAGAARREGDGLAEGGRGLSETPDFAEHKALVGEAGGIARGQRQTPVEAGERLVDAAEIGEDAGLRHPCRRLFRIGRQSRRRASQGFLGAVEHFERQRPIIDRHDIIGRQGQRLVEGDQSLGRAFEIDQHGAAIAQQRAGMGLDRQRLVQSRQGLVITAQLVERAAMIAQGVHEIRIEGQRPLKTLRRFLVPAQSPQGGAARIPDLGGVGLQRQGFVAPENRVLGASKRQSNGAEIGANHRFSRQSARRLGEGAQGVVVTAAHEMQHAEPKGRLAVAGVRREHFFQKFRRLVDLVAVLAGHGPVERLRGALPFSVAR